MVIIKIKFIGLGIGEEFQACISLYCNHEKIFEGLTYNGEIIIPNLKDNVYTLRAKFLDEEIILPIIYNKCEYTLFFRHSTLEETITFLLRDFYYDMPIERGEIILWQK